VNSTVKTILALAPYALDIISIIAQNRNQQSSVPRYLDTLSAIMKQGGEAYEELKRFTEFVELMKTENREPTESEWAALQLRSDAAHDEIQNVLLGNE